MVNNLSNIRLLKRTALLAVTSGIGWGGYQVYLTYNVLNSAIDTSIIDYLEQKPKKYSTPDNKYIVIHAPEKSTSLVDRFWDSITFSYARRLLNIAQSEDRTVRLRAVRALAQIQNLDDWHYSLLAHMCDARTAVGLARTENVDLKYFINPPNRFMFNTHERIVKWMKHFMISLNDHSDHPCLSYFIKKAFINIQEVGRMVEHDITSTEVAKCIQNMNDILPLCVESLLHHSTIGQYARDIVQLNGLPLLMEIYKRFKDNEEIVINLVKILSNISAYPELLQDVFRSGWIGVLAKLLKSPDIRIQGPAAKTLANLDPDDHLDGKYSRKVYLLHPVYRSTQHSDIDIVLVHGLLGGVFFTWRQRDQISGPSFNRLNKKNRNKKSISNSDSEDKGVNSSDPSTREFFKEVEERKKLEWDDIGKDFEVIFSDCPLKINDQGPYSCPGDKICEVEDSYTQCWPKDWLAKDCANVRVLGINYDTNLSMWAPMCPSEKIGHNTLDVRGADFLDKLIKVGVGKRPIVWLTHSMGGLLVKSMLTQAWESQDENVKDFFRNTKGIVFYSTPHRGSHVASLNQTTSLFLWPSVEVRELKEGSPALLKLHERFQRMLQEIDVKVISFVETESTIISPLKFNIHFVRNYSAQLNIGEFYEIPLDHFRICKPLNRHSFLYQKVLCFIQNIMRNEPIVDNEDKIKSY